MGIDFWFYICVVDKDGKEVYHNTDNHEFPLLDHMPSFGYHFYEHNFHRSEMAEIIGYNIDKLDKWPKNKYGQALFHRTLEQLEGIFKRRSEYICFKLFLVGLRMMKDENKWKEVRLVIVRD